MYTLESHFLYFNTISGCVLLVLLYGNTSNPIYNRKMILIWSFHWRTKYLFQYNLTAVKFPLAHSIPAGHFLSPSVRLYLSRTYWRLAFAPSVSVCKWVTSRILCMITDPRCAATPYDNGLAMRGHSVWWRTSDARPFRIATYPQYAATPYYNGSAMHDHSVGHFSPPSVWLYLSRTYWKLAFAPSVSVCISSTSSKPVRGTFLDPNVCWP